MINKKIILDILKNYAIEYNLINQFFLDMHGRYEYMNSIYLLSKHWVMKNKGFNLLFMYIT